MTMNADIDRQGTGVHYFLKNRTSILTPIFSRSPKTGLQMALQTLLRFQGLKTKKKPELIPCGSMKNWPIWAGIGPQV